MAHQGKTILGFIPDLFFSTKVRDTAKHMGHTAEMSRTTDDLIQKARALSPNLLIVDLTAEDVDLADRLTQLRGETQTAVIPLLGFTTHAAWKQTDPLHPLCNQVVTKEVFSRDLPALLQKYLGGETG